MEKRIRDATPYSGPVTLGDIIEDHYQSRIITGKRGIRAFNIDVQLGSLEEARERLHECLA